MDQVFRWQIARVYRSAKEKYLLRTTHELQQSINHALNPTLADKVEGLTEQRQYDDGSKHDDCQDHNTHCDQKLFVGKKIRHETREMEKVIVVMVGFANTVIVPLVILIVMVPVVRSMPVIAMLVVIAPGYVFMILVFAFSAVVTIEKVF